MATSFATSSSKLALHKVSTGASRTRTNLVVRAQTSNVDISRRQASAATVAAVVATLTNVLPAKALFGSGDADTKYVEATAAIIKSVGDVLEMDVKDPTREQILKDIKTTSNGYVARYRRDAKYSGRPSYGNTYTAVNALAGHLNSFGYTAAIPKKRTERIQKELSDADKMLQRGR